MEEKETIKKPSFKETVAFTTVDLEDVGLSFNAQRVGPMGFSYLRNADYGKGFRMSAISELTQLVYASLENRNYETAKNVVETLRDSGLTGNTGIHYTSKGMYVQDDPELRRSTISYIFMDEKTLENKLGNKLGSYEEKGVVFSDDKTIRFAPYGFKTGKLKTLSEVSKNSGIIALVNGEENAEKLARASKYYKLKLLFRIIEDLDYASQTNQTNFVALDSFDFNGGLGINAEDSDDFGGRFSFGVKEIKK